MHHVTRMILRGLVTVVPVAVTLYLVIWLAVSAEWIVGLAFQTLLPDGWYRPGMGLALTLPLLYGIGWTVDHWLLRGIINGTERLLARTPLVNKVFNAVQDLITYFSRDRAESFDQVVAVSFGDFTILGLVTRHDLSMLPSGLNEPGKIAVYIPGSYQIGGFTLNIPSERLTPVDMTTEDALRYAVTGGMSYTVRDLAEDDTAAAAEAQRRPPPSA